MLTFVFTAHAQENGITPSEISIGAIGALTGPLAFIGTPGRDSMTLAFDEINAKGGVCGRKLHLGFEHASSPADPFKVAVDRVRQGVLPHYKRSNCGHGIGIDVHEFPALSPANQGVELEDGMVLCVETPYYEIGWGGMMVEDIIVIRPSGNECLTHLPRELRRL